jgi:hypothetical protein
MCKYFHSQMFRRPDLNGLKHYESSCLNVVVSAKIADYLDESPAGLSLDKLSQKSGINEDKLGRVLRYLSMKHIFREGECQTSNCAGQGADGALSDSIA